MWSWILSVVILAAIVGVVFGIIKLCNIFGGEMVAASALIILTAVLLVVAIHNTFLPLFMS